MKKLLQEYRAFIVRGNLVDLATAVILGLAFNAVVLAQRPKEEPAEEAPAPSDEALLLTEIRDLLRARRSAGPPR